MKILLAHNYYKQSGGEEAVFEAERALLENKGHKVLSFVEHNKNLDGENILQMAINPIWSVESYRRIKDIIKKEKPDVAHFHNIYYILSPSVYYACKRMGIPVIQTLHNYRLACPGATLMKNGKICEKCLKEFFPWHAIVHRCWKNSFSKTSILFFTLAIHKLLKTWQKQIDLYIALSNFSKGKFVEYGLPSEKIVVKPNFIDVQIDQSSAERSGAIFVGRLSVEKGMEILLKAWQMLGSSEKVLRVIGEGYLSGKYKTVFGKSENIKFLGNLSKADVFSEMLNAEFLVFPSICYETFGLVLIEAFACGLPVIASRLGSIPEIVKENKTGLLFDPGNIGDLARKIKWAWEHPEEMRKMGGNARKEYEEKYTAEKNYKMLMDVYNRVIDNNEK